MEQEEKTLRIVASRGEQKVRNPSPKSRRSGQRSTKKTSHEGHASRRQVGSQRRWV